ncbi:MAG: Rieske 2Fe-2S domain-containing protein [Alphaproteobacteria bacterium]|nr:Rieske 2Fe-2S domain-containing protein [Alphaproteobacteria bacterium]
MRHSEQVLQAKRLLAYLDSGETALAETVYRNDVSGYTSPGHLAADRKSRAFRDVCRRRGACPANGNGNGVRAFTCPDHGWSYGLDGCLLGHFHSAIKSALGNHAAG